MPASYYYNTTLVIQYPSFLFNLLVVLLLFFSSSFRLLAFLLWYLPGSCTHPQMYETSYIIKQQHWNYLPTYLDKPPQKKEEEENFQEGKKMKLQFFENFVHVKNLKYPLTNFEHKQKKIEKSILFLHYFWPHNNNRHNTN